MDEHELKYWRKYLSEAEDSAVDMVIRESKTYVEEAVVAAIEEVEKRRRPLKQKEIAELKAHFRKREEIEEEQEKDINLLNSLSGKNHFEKNISNSITAPLLYSEKAIHFATLFAGPLIGAILLSENLRRLQRKTGPLVPAIGLIASICIVWLFSHFRLSPDDVRIHGSKHTIWITTYGAHLFCAALLRIYGWGKLIGRDLKYRPDKVPLHHIFLIAVAGIAAFVIIYVLHPF